MRKLFYIIFISIMFLQQCYSQDIVSNNSTKENLGENINSKYREENPTISPDGKILYFSRKLGPDNKGAWDIWFSILDENNEWSKAKPLNSLNDKDPNFVLSINGFNNSAMVWGGTPFSIAAKKDSIWQIVEKIYISNFRNKTTYGTFGMMCVDNKTIILSTAKGEYKGDVKEDIDIFVSLKNEKGEWSCLRSLGNLVNTTYREEFPFLAADMKTLYFSSNRPRGFGKHDIYMCKRLDNTWKKWTEPLKLGTDINGVGRDVDFTISAFADYAYLASEENSLGACDIVRVKLKNSYKPENVAIVEGKVLNKSNFNPVQATITTGNDKEQMTCIAQKDGNYRLILEPGKEYELIVEALGYAKTKEKIDLKGIKKTSFFKKDVHLTKIEENKAIRLNNTFFGSGSAVLLKKSFVELNILVDYLKENYNTRIEISGHTDNVGTDGVNLKLSQDRANSVMDYLIKKGINAERLISKGYGETKPIETNDTAEGKQKNRRVEFSIIKN